MPTLTIPNTFTPNTTAKSAEVNANFSAVSTLVNSTGLASDNIQTGGISTANLADASVTRAKLASGALKDESYEISNLALVATVGSSALTVAVKTKANSDASSTDPIYVGMRSSTASSGLYNQRSITAALSVTVSSGSTLGSQSGVAKYLYVYLIDNSGTLELAISGTKGFDQGSLQTTTAEGGAGGADSVSLLYSSTARSNVPVRLIARLKSTQATAGTWASGMTEISLTPFEGTAVPTNNSIFLDTGNGKGSTNTSVRRFTNSTTNGTAMVYADSAGNGMSITIMEAGFYVASYSDANNSATGTLGITINASGSQLTSSVAGMATANKLMTTDTSAAGVIFNVCVPFYGAPGDIIRAQVTVTGTYATGDQVQFAISKVA